MNVAIEIKPQLVRDLVVTAFEGGINYWARKGELRDASNNRLTDVQFCDQSDFPTTGQVNIWPDEPISNDAPESYSLGEAEITKGLQVMSQKYQNHFANLLTEGGWDAETADVFIQCCCFGELVFG